MIIKCPNCSQRISNKAHACPHCGLDMGSGEGLSADQAAERVRRDRKYRLDMNTYGAMAVTMAGAIWMYFSSDGLTGEIGFWPTACLAAGALWYVAVRVYSIALRFKS
ncbi:MAG: hypothetical protein QNJ40_15265 [Xanthomonadales bacterium]|nr:hypothetical protein [Xanthomonadales bacterium]